MPPKRGCIMGSCVRGACVVTGVAARRIATAATGVETTISWNNVGSAYCRAPRGGSHPSWQHSYPRRRSIADCMRARMLPSVLNLSFSWLDALVAHRRRSSRCFRQLFRTSPTPPNYSRIIKRECRQRQQPFGQARSVARKVTHPHRSLILGVILVLRDRGMLVGVVRSRYIRAPQCVHRCASKWRRAA